ncbi:nucleotidyltransferase domain-containing protein [Fusibacter ferrireducens]|uniref:Nucleotidyltransferase domain-containing protein n=1 Tax=Fusibacter ferrireducens TaxID=2785058 RepID=A0ABR9ZM35_9FIRM|nr:nucleotidyltransferase domain-containing protein [Fusibacter ferrireducens]MBF4691527.1 nucleotidyltransferase domain-containing protein [Fusibacter ferrireducens]
MISIHKQFIDKISESLKLDSRILGLAIGGSYITGEMDEFSDLDFVLAVDPKYYEAVMKQRIPMISQLGHLLSAFTGEHVSEPRLIIALYDYKDTLIHVDFKFTSLTDLAHRVENPVILWERNNCMTNAIATKNAFFPPLDYQNIEDKFWIWVHYATLKIGRGELFETIEFLSFLRQNVIGSMLLVDNGKLPKGVRKLEFYELSDLNPLIDSIANYDSSSCINSLEILISLYLKLRETLFDDTIILRNEAQSKTIAYLNSIKHK